jgi:putative ABC transport system ATP-binding protein
VDLTVRAGDFVMVTGPSGSGKSTLLHLAALLDHPSEGRLVFEGRDVSALAETELCGIRKHRIGMVFQKYCLLPHRSVLENVLFRFRYTGHTPERARAAALGALRQMDMEAVLNRPARVLSGGEMQRVAIARAVALRPALLVADEPTGNLDAGTAGAVMQCFRTLHREGLTILMVTHNAALLPFCTRHLLCRDGELAGGA